MTASAVNFGNALHAALVSAGRDQQWLAGELEVSEQTVSWWRTGRHLPHAARLQKIAAALGRDPADVVGWAAPSSAAPPAPGPESEQLLRELVDILQPAMETAKTTAPDLMSVLERVQRHIESG